MGKPYIHKLSKGFSFKPQTWMSMQFFAFFFTWGIYIPYWVPWLTSRGFSIADASMLFSIGLVARAFSTMFIFPRLCKHLLLPDLAKWIACLSVIFASFFIIPFEEFYIALIFMILFNLIYPIHLALNESFANAFMKKGKLDYGKSRSWGSIGYVVAVLIIGWAISRIGDQAVIDVMVVGCLLLLLGTFIGIPEEAKVRNDSVRLSLLSLFKLPGFALCFFICFLTQGAHAAYYNYGVLYLKDLGIGDTWISLLLALQIPVEILFFYISDRLLGRMPVYKMLGISIIFSIVRWSFVFFFQDLFIFIFTQLLHAITFALTHYAFVRFTNEQVPNEYIPSAFGSYSALVMSLSVGMLGAVGGWLSQYSIRLPFLGMALICIPCLLLCYLFMKREERLKFNKHVYHDPGVKRKRKTVI